MKIKCTDEQVKKMAALAINSSIPVGMGILHHKPELVVSLDDLEIREDYAGKSLSIDYYQGRMVKFHARKFDDETWSFNPDELNVEYQSWKKDYPSWQHLFEAIQ